MSFDLEAAQQFVHDLSRSERDGISEALVLALNEIERLRDESFMPHVKGQRFHCQCGVSVFTRPLIYRCNGCGADYEGTERL